MILRRFLLRCDGGSIPEIGTGHVRRSLALADGLKRDAGNEILFLTRPGVLARRLERAGHRVRLLEGDGLAGLLSTAREERIDIVFLDDLGQSAQAIEALRAEGRVVISMDDPHTPQLADLSINPGFPSEHATYSGLDRTILLKPLPGGGARDHQWDLFVSFGGHDAGDLCAVFLEHWLELKASARVLIAVSEDHAQLDKLRERACAAPLVDLQVDVDFSSQLPRSRLAITNGGTTLFMAAALGVPTLCVAQYEHQVGNAQRLVQLGATRFHGLSGELNMAELVREARALLESPTARAQLSRAGRRAFPGLGLRHALQTLMLVERLEWDSEFFGQRIATLHPRRLTEGILRFALQQCRREGIECLYFLGQTGHEPTRQLAEAHGFRAVDDRLTYGIALDSFRERAASSGTVLRPGVAQDGPALAAIAGTSYGDSRYFHDARFARERCEQFYRDWILKSLEGRFDDEVLVAEVEGRLAGYISCRVATPNLGTIGLVGIHPEFRWQGLGKRLLRRALDWFSARDLPQAEVVTQGRNLAAQKLYESCGFVLRRREKWYHNWLDER